MKNRWLIALSAVGIHICIGSVYAWSVLTKPIMAQMGFSLQETTWTFSIAILFLGLSAGFLGTFVEKKGPRISGLTATTFFGIGMFGTALALYLQNLALLYICYGVIGGIGLGIGYITPVSTLVKYFPKKRGFATGLAIMGFGFASLIAGPIMQILVSNFGLVTNFIILGCVYILIMGASSLYLAPPPKEFVEKCNKFGGNLPDAQGVPEDMLNYASKHGVAKINIDTDLRLAMTSTIREFFIEHPEKFDPREYMGPGRTAVKEMVMHKMRDELGTAGHADD